MKPAAEGGAAAVTLLTDFGGDEPYAGVMKGVILSRSPSSRLVDLTHQVPPQAVVQGAFLLETAWRYFPAGTVHLAVVDPGVGTERGRIALLAGGHYFVGPDNGLLSAALPPEARGPRAVGAAYAAVSVRLPPDARAVAIEDESIFNRPVSATFEGRDVFAPAAACLAAGAQLEELGPPLAQAFALPAFRAARDGNGLDGVILHADRYGNLITDIDPTDLPDEPVFVLETGGPQGARPRRRGSTGEREILLRLAPAYAAAGLAAIAASSGRVEIAARNGSAARLLGLGPGDRVRVRKDEQRTTGSEVWTGRMQA